MFLEPGDYLAKDAAILLVEVVTVEEKGGVRFVGVDCGFNAFNLPAIYHYHQEIVLCRAADATPTMSCTVAGHINEAGDLFAEGCRLPAVHEGDVLAFLSAGGYGSLDGVPSLRAAAGRRSLSSRYAEPFRRE